VSAGKLRYPAVLFGMAPASRVRVSIGGGLRGDIPQEEWKDMLNQKDAAAGAGVLSGDCWITGFVVMSTLR
jgi:hypothetical protein